MLPALLLIGRRPWVLPGPVFLFWPLIGLGWVLVGIGAAVRRVAGRGRRAEPGRIEGLRAALKLCGQLSGLRVDVTTREGSGITLRFL